MTEVQERDGRTEGWTNRELAIERAKEALEHMRKAERLIVEAEDVAPRNRRNWGGAVVVEFPTDGEDDLLMVMGNVSRWIGQLEHWMEDEPKEEAEAGSRAVTG